MNTTVDYCAITREAINDITKQISSLSMLPIIIEDSDNIWKVYNKSKNVSLTIDKTDKDNITVTIESKFDNCNTSTKHIIKLNTCNRMTLWYFYDYMKNANKLLAMSSLFNNTKVYPVTLAINSAIQEVLAPLVHRKNI